MTPNELAILNRFLDDYGDKLGNAGCNDFELPNTKENRDMLDAVNRWNDPKWEYEKPSVYKGKIITMDFLVLGYLQHRLNEHFGTKLEK